MKQKTFTNAMIEKLKAECLRVSRTGKCDMSCEAHKAHIGWCDAVWKAVNK